jgi:hypothetical protein
MTNLAEWLERLTAIAKVAKSWILRGADEAVLNKIHEEKNKIPLFLIID